MKDTEFNDLLNSMIQDSNFSSFDGEDFDDEDFANFTPRQRAMLKKTRSAQQTKRIQTEAGKPSIKRMAGNPNFKASFDLIVTCTNGTGTPVAGTGYDYFLFGVNELQNGFTSICTDSNFVKGTSTVKLGIWGNAGATTAGIIDSLTIVYAAATHPTIVVRMSENDYPTFLQALITDMFHITRIRVQAAETSANGLLSIQSRIKIINRSTFGKKEEDYISLSSMKMPEQNQAGIIDVPVDMWVDANVTLIPKVYLVNATASALQNTITWTFFLDTYYKHNPANLYK